MRNYCMLVVGLILHFTVIVTAQCPYKNPRERMMTCLMDMPRVDSGHRPLPPPEERTLPNPPETTVPPPPRKRRQATDDDGSVESPPTRPLGVPIITGEFAEYICRNDSSVLDCAFDIYDKCSGEPAVMEVSFNPEQAKKAKKMCNNYNTVLQSSIPCINTSSRSERMEECVLSIPAMLSESDTPIGTMFNCRTTAEVYNCLVSKMGGDCGEAVVSFLITTWRTMEPNYCTGIINTHYKEPISDAVQLRTNLGQLGLLVLTMIIFI